MTDQLLLVSRIAFLVLVYLVFVRVARAVMVEVRAETSGGSDRLSPAEAPVATNAGSRSATVPRRPSATSTITGRRLTVMAPAHLAGSSFALDAEVTIGRAPGCAVSIDNAKISKLHARVFESEGRWVIADLGSTNGTTVNGDPCGTPVRLSPGDRIGIGEAVLEFE